MKNLLASTAIALAFASPVFADAHGEPAFLPNVSAEAVFASDLVGARLYTSEKEIEGEYTDADQEWDDVGEIHDIVLDKNGEIRAILADIGGFLGIGEKTIAISMDDLTFVSDGDEADEYFVVLKGNEAMLENAPEFTWDENEAMEESAEAEMKTEAETAEVEMETETEHANAKMEGEKRLYSEDRDFRFTPPTIEREGYQTTKLDGLTTDDVTGARVYDANDEWIGEVNSIVLDSEGKLGDAILDVGGFLGIGEKRVAVNFNELTLQTDANGDDVRIYIDATKEQLEALPEVDM